MFHVRAVAVGQAIAMAVIGTDPALNQHRRASTRQAVRRVMHFDLLLHVLAADLW